MRVEIRLKRAYEAASQDDGYRVLVDRLWPRGVSKKELRIDAWEKELAPSDGLRKWFGHEPGRFREFAERYEKELPAHKDALERLRAQKRVTLVYAAKDTQHNNAVVLARVLESG